MTIQEQIREEIKKAMFAKDQLRLETMRGLLAAFTNELVATKRTPQEPLPDEDALKVIKRASNQRKDSIDQFEKGGRKELADKERAELAIIETFLPKMMSKDEIRKIAEAKKAELGVNDKSKMGVFMGTVMKELKGRADGTDVKEVVESLFI
ncbi:MAG: GatB/YqeY domain-containing protein [Candidatus Parcubacteria bacterium]|nr:GatB/YqeY domain-containing protein [Candidatus Parcubacteria bacterium]